MFLYNTLTRKKEKFKALSPPDVRMYCCGPTVYGLLHVGNFRGVVVYNLLRLWLEHLGYKVTYHYNFTDVDDKIIKKAKQASLTCEQVSQKYIQEFVKDFKSLNLKDHDLNPRATQSIPAMIKLIEALIQKKRAYIKDGNVFYRVQSFKKYGQLSNRKLEDLKEGDHIEATKFKEAPEDFALWKKSKESEPSWSSPWGEGRPGWHIECTAMIHQGLGSSIDIHGGGVDLIFPHHENERAQSEGFTDKSFVGYWVHHNMFEFEGQKLSKSLNSPQIMHDFLEEYDGEIFKYLVLNSHYRSVVEFSNQSIHLSISALSRIYNSLFVARQVIERGQKLKVSESPFLDKQFQEKIKKTRENITEALNDDLNSPKALSHLFVLARFFNQLFNSYPIHFKQTEYDPSFKVMGRQMRISQAYLELFNEYSSIFSLFQQEPRRFLETLDQILFKKSGQNEVEITGILKKRDEARKCKNFNQADQLRDELSQKGIEIQDIKGGSYWKMKVLDL